jgi:hypothetical protein
MGKLRQPRLRVRRLTNMPPRPKPSTAPSTAAVNMVLGEEPPVPRDKRTEVYAMAKVQKASRTYMGYLLGRLSHGRTRKLQKVWAFEPDYEIPGV